MMQQSSTRTSNKEASNKEASNKEASNKEASNKEASNKEASNKEASNKEAKPQNTPRDQKPNATLDISDDERPKWRPSDYGLLILAFLAICYTLYFARAVLLPMIAALVFALPLRPFVRYLTKYRLPSWAAAIFVILGAGFVVGLTGYVLINPASQWIADAPTKLALVERKFRSIKKPIDDISDASDKMEEITEDKGSLRPLKVEVEQPSLVSTMAGQTANAGFGILLMILVLFFLLARGDALLANIVKLMPTRRNKKEALQLVGELEQAITGYTLKITIINLCLGAIMAIIFWILGLPNPILWGVMVALFNYVPIFGFVVGAAIVAVVSVITFDSMLYAAVPPSIYMLINGLEGNVITPMILGRAMKLNAIMVLLFLVMWGWMWGVPGAILAVPLLAATKIVCDRFEKLQPIGELIG